MKTLKLKIAGDGSVPRTSVVDMDTGEKINNVQRIEMVIDAKTGQYQTSIELVPSTMILELPFAVDEKVPGEYDVISRLLTKEDIAKILRYSFITDELYQEFINVMLKNFATNRILVKEIK